jgi:hypothetical protein
MAKQSKVLVYIILGLISGSSYSKLNMGADAEYVSLSVTTLVGTSGSADGNRTTAGFNNPYGVSTLPLPTSGMVVADFGNHAIRYVTIAGVVSTLAGSKGVFGAADGTATAALFYHPHDIATLPNGNIVVADTYNHAIRHITMPNGVVSTIAGSLGNQGKVDGTGSAALFYSPQGITTLPNGDIVVADTWNHAIRYITATRVVTTLAGSKGTSGTADGTGGAALLNLPCGLSTFPNGDIVVADMGNNAIRYITANGVVSTLAGMKGTAGIVDGTGDAALFYRPYGIATLPDGNIVVADTYNNAIRYVTMPDGVVRTLAGDFPTKQAGFLDGIGTAARFNSPYGIAFLPNGTMVVADRGNNAIRYVTLSKQTDSPMATCPQEMCNGYGFAVRDPMNDTSQNCSCDCFPGYDRVTNCSSKLPCPESTCNGNGNVTGNILDGCGCVCLDAFDNRTNCSTPIPCLNTTCHGKGNASGNVQIGCRCDCEPGYNASTNCSTPLQCPSSMCNGNGNVTGNILDGCGCVCLDTFDNRTNCSTPAPCPNGTCHDKGTVMGNLIIGCNCSCEMGFDPNTNCSTVVTAVPLSPPNASATVTSSPATEISSTVPSTHQADPTSTVVPLESKCGLSTLENVSVAPLLDQEYERMWVGSNSSAALNISCVSERNCAVTMRICDIASRSSSAPSCDGALDCTLWYIQCLFQAAQNRSEAGCIRLQALNESLREWTSRRDDADFELTMLRRCVSSTCGILTYVSERSCDLRSLEAACPFPPTTVRRLSEPATASVVSTIVGRTAATVIVSTTTGGTAVAALVSSPTAATKAPALASLNQVIQCAFTDGDTEPSSFDFPVPASIGSSPFAKYVGSGLVTTLCLVVIPGVGILLLSHVGRGAGRTLRLLQRKVLANGVVMTLGYFGPLAFKLPTLIIWHSRALTDVTIALLCPLLVLCLILYLLFAVVRRFDSSVAVITSDGNSSELDFANKKSECLFVETFGLLFDACRSVDLKHRLLYFEDFLVAALLQLLEGVRPERENSCGAVAAMMGVVCWMHTLYLVVVRPYGDRLELVLVIIGSLMMSAMATLGIIITMTVPFANMTQSPEFTVFAYLGLGTTLCFFVQSSVLGLAALVDANKKAFEKRIAVDEKDSVTLELEKVTSSLSDSVQPQGPVLCALRSSMSPTQGNPEALEIPLVPGRVAEGTPIDRVHRSGRGGSVYNPLAF